MAGMMFEISQAMVEEVMKEYETDNPGRTVDSMSADEFAERMMKKFSASAKPISEPGHA